MENIKSYLCNTEAKARKLLAYLKGKGYRWASGSDLDNLYGFNPEKGTYYNAHEEEKEVTFCYEGSMHELKSVIMPSIPSDLIHLEYENEFKKLFKLNRMPDALTESQVVKMKELKIDKLWMTQP